MCPVQKTVMIAENEPDLPVFFAETMRLSGLQVIKACISMPATRLIAREQPDVSGLEVLRRKRRQPSLASVPVVAISAKASSAYIGAGLDAEASVGLTKPATCDDLMAGVDGLLQAA